MGLARDQLIELAQRVGEMVAGTAISSVAVEAGKIVVRVHHPDRSLIRRLRAVVPPELLIIEDVEETHFGLPAD